MENSSCAAGLKLWLGAGVIGVAYVLTYAAASWALAQPGRGLDWAMGPPMAYLMAVVPYLVGGLYCRLTSPGTPGHYPLWTGLLAVSVERLFILGVGFWLFARGGDGSMAGISLLTFIQGEAAPYFTLPYITIGGIASVAITFATGVTSRPRAA